MDVAEEGLGQVIHCVGFTSALFCFADAVDGRDVSDEGLGHVVDQSHADAAGGVDFGGEGRRAEEGDDGHAVHVVGDGFAVVDVEAAPALAFGGLEALEEVEEGEWGGGVGGGLFRECLEDWWFMC